MAYRLTGSSGSYVHTDSTQWASIPGTTYTIMARFDVQSLGTGENALIVFDPASGESMWWYARSYTYANQLNLWNGSSEVHASDSHLTTGVQCFAASRTTNNGTLKGYVDGVLKETHDANSSAAIEMAFGSNKDGTSENVQADVWDVRIWNVVLTDEEVDAEYDSETPVKTSGLVAWYPLIGDAQDDSGNDAPNILVSGGSWVGTSDALVQVAALTANADSTVVQPSPQDALVVCSTQEASADQTQVTTEAQTVGVGDIVLYEPPATPGDIALAGAEEEGTAVVVAIGAAAGGSTVTVIADWIVSTLVATAIAAAPNPAVSGSAVVQCVAASASAEVVEPFAGAPSVLGDVALLDPGGSSGDVRLSGTEGVGHAIVNCFVADAVTGTTSSIASGTTGGAALVIPFAASAAATGIVGSFAVSAKQYVYVWDDAWAWAAAGDPEEVGQPGLAYVFPNTGPTAVASMPAPIVHHQTSNTGNVALRNSGSTGNIVFVGSGSTSVTVQAGAASATAAATSPTASGEEVVVVGNITLRSAGPTGNIAFVEVEGSVAIACLAGDATASVPDSTVRSSWTVPVVATGATATAPTPTIIAEGIVDASVSCVAATATAGVTSVQVSKTTSNAFPLLAPQRYSRLPLYDVLVSSMDTAGDQARKMTTLDNLYEYRVGWDFLTTTQMQEFDACIDATWGGWRPVYFFECEELPTDAPVWCADGTGVARTFTIPARLTSGTVVTVDGDDDWVTTFSQGTGPNGEDEVTFVSATPPLGSSIEATYAAGYRRRSVRLTGTPQWLDRNPGGEGWTLDVVLVQTDQT